MKVSDDSTPIQISIEISSMPVDQIVKSKLTAHLQASEGTYDYFKLYTREQVEVGDVATLIDNAVYFFKPPIQLDPQSGSTWTQKQLVELKVVFDRMPIEEDFFELSTARSDKAEALIIELQDLTSGTIDRYRELRPGASRDDQSLNFLQDSIYKAVYMVQKYGDHESVVDCFVHLLLDRLGFFSDWLFVFPQLRLKLKYGAGIVKEATADFTVMDVVSFLRMAVMEDKRLNDTYLNSEPQLVAELIAMAQANSEDEAKNNGAQMKGVNAPPIIGVRVNALSFWFYRVDNTINLLNAMASNSSASEATTIKKLGDDTHGLNFLVSADREIIIRTLAAICDQFRSNGLSAKRRQSHAPVDHDRK